MFKKILATSVLVTLLTSMTLAQEAPGKSSPIIPEVSEEESVLVLESAPSDPTRVEMSEITIVPEMYEAVVTFTTEPKMHAGIEYGLTPEYEHSISTEPQTQHTETLGELNACTTYYYRVFVGDTSREGEFKTLCPKVVVQKTKAPSIQNTEYKVQNEGIIGSSNSELVTASDIQPTISDEQSAINEQEIVLDAAPEAPSLPGPIAFGNDTIAPTASVDDGQPVSAALLLFALLSGMVVVFFSLKKKKKWYQR